MEDDNDTSCEPAPLPMLERIAPRRSTRRRRRRPTSQNAQLWLQDEVTDALRDSPSGLLVREIAERVPDGAYLWHHGQTKEWHVEEVLRHLELHELVARDRYRPPGEADATRWFVAPGVGPSRLL